MKAFSLLGSETGPDKNVDSNDDTDEEYEEEDMYEDNQKNLPKHTICFTQSANCYKRLPERVLWASENHISKIFNLQLLCHLLRNPSMPVKF